MYTEHTIYDKQCHLKLSCRFFVPFHSCVWVARRAIGQLKLCTEDT